MPLEDRCRFYKGWIDYGDSLIAQGMSLTPHDAHFVGAARVAWSGCIPHMAPPAPVAMPEVPPPPAPSPGALMEPGGIVEPDVPPSDPADLS